MGIGTLRRYHRPRVVAEASAPEAEDTPPPKAEGEGAPEAEDTPPPKAEGGKKKPK